MKDTPQTPRHFALQRKLTLQRIQNKKFRVTDRLMDPNPEDVYHMFHKNCEGEDPHGKGGDGEGKGEEVEEKHQVEEYGKRSTLIKKSIASRIEKEKLLGHTNSLAMTKELSPS